MVRRYVHLRHPYNRAGDGPEGPEVRTVADCLRPHVEGMFLLAITCKDTARASNLQYLNLPILIIKVCTYGKKLRFMLSGGIEIVFSLGMTGRLQWEEGPHSSIIMDIGQFRNEGILKIYSNCKKLYFDDTRRFGTMQVISSPTSSEYLDLGPDVLQAALSKMIDLEIWISRFTQKKYLQKQIAQVLLEQSIVSGIGNYLKSEILYYARIHPERLVSSLTPEEWRILHSEAHRIIKLSYDHGGYTLATYISPNGQPGQYPAVVYGKKADPNGREIVNIKTKDGRTTYYAPELQH